MGVKAVYSEGDLATARQIITRHIQGESEAEIAAEYNLGLDVVLLVLAGAAHLREGIEECYDAVAKVEFLADDEEHEKRNAEMAQAACDEVVCIATKYVPGLDTEDPWHEWPEPGEGEPEPETVEIRVGVVHSEPDVGVIGKTKSTLRTREDAILVAKDVLKDELRKAIPADHVCSMVIAVEDSNAEVTFVQHDHKDEKENSDAS